MTSVGTFNPPSPGRAPALFGVALGEWLMMIDNQVVYYIFFGVYWQYFVRGYYNTMRVERNEAQFSSTERYVHDREGV